MAKRYQRGNPNIKKNRQNNGQKIPKRYSEYQEEETKQWPKEKVQKNKQRSTKDTHKTKD
jgi:hypothetical protein